MAVDLKKKTFSQTEGPTNPGGSLSQAPGQGADTDSCMPQQSRALPFEASRPLYSHYLIDPHYLVLPTP